jgi:hypothetical protein
VIWAREARERWQARALAIVVVANDWDESLAVYKVGPGFHHYVEGPGGSLVLNRFDYQPSWWRQAVRSSALGRYLFFNLQVQDRLHVGSPAQTQQYVGNTPAAADRERLDRSRTATRAFLRDLVAVAGWSPDRVVSSTASAIRPAARWSWAATSCRCAPPSWSRRGRRGSR